MIANIVGAAIIDLIFAYFGLVVKQYDEVKESEEYINLTQDESANIESDREPININTIKI